ncbi:MlaD family protein [Capilliphycus salinus ALCB114379]|uniref:MlaD family protein n=1 Tax=Capilliphycus salinus TaxID=2768948 RepID=UPI0039A49C33
MRSRAIREGSVGLLTLFGLSLFGMFAFWVQGLRLNNEGYQIRVEFPDATGMQPGTPVRYRGVKVGQVSNIKPTSNLVEVQLDITSSDLVIPRDVVVRSSQTGLLSENFVDIVPRTPVSEEMKAFNPLSSDCPETIICDETILSGESGISLERLMASMVEFSELYTNPELFKNLNQAAARTALAADEVSKLSTKMTELVEVAQTELGSMSSSVDRGIGAFSTELSSISATLQNSTNEVTRATIESANSVQRTANEVSTIANQVQVLIASNRSSLSTTLENIEQITGELSLTVASLNPLLTKIEQGQLLNNLEVLSANAAEASENLLDLSRAVNDPDTIILLQQTLDSARTTLQNVEKLTSDVDDLIGDPQVRQSLREIINGLGNILTYTDQLEEQTKLAKTLAPLSEILEYSEAMAIEESLSKSEEKPLLSPSSFSEETR